MATLTDARFNALRAQGYTGTTRDMLHQWLAARTSTEGHIDDLWEVLFDLNGIPPGHRTDREAALWKALGYTSEYYFWLAGGYSPRFLFLHGEQGTWYDPSDLTTLYQDSAGTTPVTADGDPVGLMLDKSQGLQEGGEQVSNTDFSSGSTGWSGARGNETLSVVGGRLRVTAIASGAFGASTVMASLAAGHYRWGLYWDKATVGGIFNPRVANNAALSSADIATAGTLTGSGDHQQLFNNPSTNTRYTGVIAVANNPGEYFEIDDFSIREVPGNHATQSSSALKPIYRTDGTLHWLEFDGVDDYLASASITLAQPETSAVAWSLNTFDGLVFKTMLASLRDTTKQPYIGQASEDAGANGSLRINAGSVLGAATDYAANSEKVVSLAIFNGASSIGRQNGVQLISGDAGSTDRTAVTIGGWRAQQTPDGNFYGAIIVEGVSSSLSEIEQYLATKSGVTL